MTTEIHLLCMWGLSLAGTFFMGAGWALGRSNKQLELIANAMKADIRNMEIIRDEMAARVEARIAGRES